MVSAISDPHPEPRGKIPVKIVVAGGFGVGKSTFVGSISEIEPLRSEATMTSASSEVDDLQHTATKTTTTVAMDFGRSRPDRRHRAVPVRHSRPGTFPLHVERAVSRGAIGAVVLADSRRLSDCFVAVDYFEARNLPFIVAINPFDGKTNSFARSHSRCCAARRVGSRCCTATHGIAAT